MKITKEQVGIVILGVALGLWSSIWVSAVVSIAIGLGFIGWCIVNDD